MYIVLLKFPAVFSKMVDGVCAPTSQPHELKKPRPNNPRPPGPTPPSPSPTSIPDNSSGDASGATTTTSGSNDDVNPQQPHQDTSPDIVPALPPTASQNHNTHPASPSSLRSLQCFSTLKSGFKRLFFCIPSAERHP